METAEEKMGTDQQVRIVYLNDGDHLDSVVIRLEKGWKVRFMRASSLLGRDVEVSTSLAGKLKWSEHADDLAAYAEFDCTTAGAFSYEFFVNGSESPSGSGFLQVLPELRDGDTVIPLNGIVCQTYIAKLLGTFPEWEDRLLVAKESGYNMVHFTPVQKLGASNSSYCIANPLELNPVFSTSCSTLQDRKYGMKALERLIEKMAKEWGILSIQDVVWNHAASNAPFLQKHPECSYNCLNSPHLRPAYVLDRLLYHFGREVAAGQWTEHGLPPVIEKPEHLSALEEILMSEVLPRMRLHEFFEIDIEKRVGEFSSVVRGGPCENPLELENSPQGCCVSNLDELLMTVPGSEWKRFGHSVNMTIAHRFFNRERSDAANEEERQAKCLESFRNHLACLNEKNSALVKDIHQCITKAVLGHVGYERVDPSGPQKKELSEKSQLLSQYFLHPFETVSWEDDEKYAYDSTKACYLMACNGWVMGDDPLKNFAVYPSQVYLRRELVCWGDCVKLRYGDKPADCPYLWNLMRDYSQAVARLFHGVRIDNCHSTPIHVAEYLLKAAREIRPDLYVVAELFTGSEDIDNIFVNRLGITSLIREAQNAHDSHEQGRFVYRYGGDVVGAFIQSSVQDASPDVAHALFYDQTHDNPPPEKKRTVHDVLATAGMVGIAGCANGSTRGYDELIPFKIDVVKETRFYKRWQEIGPQTGIIGARRAINHLHDWLARNNYKQVFVDQMNFDIVGITRHNPETHDTVILVAHTCFSQSAYCNDRPPVKNVEFKGHLDEIVFEASLESVEGAEETHDESELCGLRGFTNSIREHIKSSDSTMVTVHGDEDGEIELSHFPSGSVIAFKISPLREVTESVRSIRQFLSGETEKVDNELENCLEKMSLQSYNRVLFRCEAEEKDDLGTGAYNIPGFGSLVYCGFQGLVPLLDKIRTRNDLGHPLCGNIREGTWLCDYISGRLQKQESTHDLGEIIKTIMSPLATIPHFLRPAYFEAVFMRIYHITCRQLFKKLKPSLATASEFVKSLVLSSVSFLGSVNSAGLAPLSSSVELEDKLPSSLAAGLPHFTTGIWRNWGRDTFIALPGCCLITGRYYDAKCLILSYAGALRHGLIPNLLGEGKCSRYNSRDSVWFWLLSIVKYIRVVPNGESILHEKVLRIYPSDDTIYGENQKEEELCETMFEALNRHFNGICFRERNAGPAIDEQMNDAGFNVSAYIDRDTGFVYGGNEWNCGTWMDKMGSSEKAGNKGFPATPRDGAAVELTGLAYAVLCDLDQLHKKGHFQYEGVKKGDVFWTWADWMDRINANFKQFVVTADDHTPGVNKINILKDSVGSKAVYTDYQLRPNFCIALAESPQLLDPEIAWKAIEIAEEVLLGPIGIKTLDPTDWNYNGFYNNDDDGTERKTAKGWNYHQGPEWVWVAAYFLRAKLIVAKRMSSISEDIYKQAYRSVRARMGNYWKYLQESAWTSLPELTNENGAFCAGSCHAQAWSVGCLLETIDELYK
ncbi:hypothetical protein AB6A40_000176 [Gnathostoma spinigerum]|uniref:Glycogen debranching enzyme n=1 Tax=Gnathostoma spinigerum TaxID=75299 RepID=A0ABD6E3N1_9BILA